MSNSGDRRNFLYFILGDGKGSYFTYKFQSSGTKFVICYLKKKKKELNFEFTVAELMLWKNKRESAAMAAGISGVWLVVEVLDYHFVTLVFHILIILMFLLFLWKKLAFFPISW